MSSRGGYFKSASLGSGETVGREVEADPEQLGDGATVSILVERATTNYDVNVVWQDEDGNDIITESLATGVTAGTQSSHDVAARSNRCKVEVVDAGSGSGAVDGSAYLG